MTASDLQHTFSGAIPSHYDRCLGPAWFAMFAANLAARLPADPGGDVLEIACGTGILTRLLRERLAAGRRLVATDLNPPMLDYARSKVALDGINWQQADATKLPFPDGRFAALACSFGVMFVPDRAALFAEARRVLRPGGTLIFNVWDRIENNPCMRTYAEVIEGMFPGDKEVQFRVPYAMYDVQTLRALLDAAGFEARSIETVRLPVTGIGAHDIATGQVRGTPRGLLLASRGVDFDVVIASVTAALERVGGAGSDFRSHCQALVVEAVAPA